VGLGHAIPDGVLAEHDPGDQHETMSVLGANQAPLVHRNGAIGDARVGEQLSLWRSRHGRDSAPVPEKSGQVCVRTLPRAEGRPGSTITLLPGCDRAVRRRPLCQEVWIRGREREGHWEDGLTA
jgi:hypothetical protein